MQTTRTKNQITRKKIFTYVIVVIGAVLIFAAPLVHMEFPKRNAKVENYKAELDESLLPVRNELLQLENNYESRVITAENYITSFKKLKNDLETQESKNNELLDTLVDSERIFDWKTMRIFLVGIGTRIPFLFFSIIISFLIVRIEEKDKYLNRAFNFLQFSCYTISFYQLVWVFWPGQDFPLEAYRWGIIASCVPIAIGCTYFIKYYDSNLAILKSKIRYIMNLMIKQAVDNGHIKNEERYDDEIVYPALKKLDE